MSLGTITADPISIADFNGDGKPDILCVKNGSQSQSVHIRMNQGGGNFSDTVAGGLNGIVGFANVIDFNLDGIPDLVVQQQQVNGGVMYSFQGSGNGSFAQVGMTNIPEPLTLAVGDFDHDGFPDLIAGVSPNPAELYFFFGDGHGNFIVQPAVGPFGGQMAVGDFNGDGLPDVALADLDNFATLAFGRRDRNFPAPVALHPATVTALSTSQLIADNWGTTWNSFACFRTATECDAWVPYAIAVPEPSPTCTLSFCHFCSLSFPVASIHS